MMNQTIKKDATRIVAGIEPLRELVGNGKSPGKPAGQS
jgi:hypothetical protein